MVFLKLILAFVLLQAPGTTPARPVPPASIEGIITGPSGEPLSKVTVTASGIPDSIRSVANSLNANAGAVVPPGAAAPLLNSQQPMVATTQDGKFTFENLKPGSYLIEAERAGYVSNEYGQRGPNGMGSSVVLTAGQKLKGMQIILTPQGAIAGRVVDRNGQPLSGAVVQAIHYDYQERGRSLNVVQAVTTNDMGEYRLYWLPPGPYIVCVTPEVDPSLNPMLGPNNAQLNMVMLRVLTSMGRAAGTAVNSRTLNDGSTIEESSVPVFYPGVYTAQEAATVLVRAGSTIGGTNIVAAPAHAQRIRGITINGTTGLPESMQISLTPRNSSILTGISSSLRSADNGSFEITGVVPGSYYLIASGDISRAVLPVDIANSDLNNVALTTTVGLTINGRVTIDTPLPGGATPGVPLQIRLLSTNPALPAAAAAIETNRFQLAGVLPGDYFVNLLGNGDRYLKSVRLGGQDGLGDPIHIQDQPQTELDIVISKNTGRLEGRVLNERREPVSNATIVVIPDVPLRQRTSMYYTPRADSSGRFQIDAAPGRYQVFAWEDIERFAWFDADFMRTFEGRGRSVIISENGRESVEVTMFPYVP